MIQKYYAAQKANCYLFLIIGILSLLTVGFLIFNSPNTFKIGLILPLLIIGSIQLFISIKALIQLPIELKTVLNFIPNNTSNFIDIEIPKINKILIHYKTNTIFYLTLISISVVLLFLINNDLFNGVGLTLFPQSFILITAHYFSHQRRLIYIKWLTDYYN